MSLTESKQNILSLMINKAWKHHLLELRETLQQILPNPYKHVIYGGRKYSLDPRWGNIKTHRHNLTKAQGIAFEPYHRKWDPIEQDIDEFYAFMISRLALCKGEWQLIQHVPEIIVPRESASLNQETMEHPVMKKYIARVILQ